jgi:hypothetical protein
MQAVSRSTQLRLWCQDLWSLTCCRRAQTKLLPCRNLILRNKCRFVSKIQDVSSGKWFINWIHLALVIITRKLFMAAGCSLFFVKESLLQAVLSDNGNRLTRARFSFVCSCCCGPQRLAIWFHCQLIQSVPHVHNLYPEVCHTSVRFPVTITLSVRSYSHPDYRIVLAYLPRALRNANTC